MSIAVTEAPDIVTLDDVHLTLASAAGAVPILRGLSLAVHRGETLGIIGPSGSGKSTLLAVLAGLERPNTGRVHVAGSDLTTMNEDQAALFRRKNIGIVFQAFHLIPSMTALENVAVPLELAGRKDAFARAQTELEAVGLGHRLGHLPSELSGGEQQRVALARALAGEPALLLADEPTGNLDGATGHAVIDLIFALHARRKNTLILITHDPALAARCDRVARLLDGQIAAIDTVHGA